MLTDVHRGAIRRPGNAIGETSDEKLQCMFADLVRDANEAKRLPMQDAEAFRRMFASERRQGKKLKVALAYSVMTACSPNRRRPTSGRCWTFGMISPTESTW